MHQFQNQKQTEARVRLQNLLTEKAAMKPNPLVHLEDILLRRFVCTRTGVTKYYIFS